MLVECVIKNIGHERLLCHIDGDDFFFLCDLHTMQFYCYISNPLEYNK